MKVGGREDKVGVLPRLKKSKKKIPKGSKKEKEVSSPGREAVATTVPKRNNRFAICPPIDPAPPAPAITRIDLSLLGLSFSSDVRSCQEYHLISITRRKINTLPRGTGT